MAKALIVGAGAIGRGYLPWELKNFELTFFDTNTNLIDSLKESGGYKTFMSFGTHLENYYVNNANFESSIKNINLDNFDIAIVCVGPRNLKHLPVELGAIKCPMYSLENDYATVYELRHLLNKTNIYFGVPDVITSLTASPENLKEDINSLHTENGVLYLEDHGDIPEKLKDLMPEVEWVSKERMIKEWDAKLYIHNTPHCIAAFYGYLHDCEYVHDALAIDSVKLKLGGVVDEVLLCTRCIARKASSLRQRLQTGWSESSSGWSNVFLEIRVRNEPQIRKVSIFTPRPVVNPKNRYDRS